MSTYIRSPSMVFFFFAWFFFNDYRYKKNSEVYDLSRFNNNSLSDDFNNRNWDNSGMEIENNDVTISFKNYLNKISSLIMPYVSIKKLNKQQQKFIQNLVTKNDLHGECKSYRNKFSAIIKESKRKYYDDYFRANLTIIKKNT